MISYIRNSKTISGRLGDEMVMMDIDRGEYFSLNPVATRIWELLVQPFTLDDLCNILSSEYEVEQGQCKSEVEQHIRKMMNFGLIVQYD